MTPRPPYHWSDKPGDNSPWWLLCLIPVGGLVAGTTWLAGFFN